MGRICEVCGGPIPANKRSDAKVCSDYCRIKKYTQTETGKRKSVEKTRRYQLSKKGQETKRRADAKYYENHKEKWLTNEKLYRAKCCQIARRVIKNAKRPYKCVECGTNFVKLDVHHIDEDWENNDPSNLEYRCKKCHDRVHGKVPKIVPIDDSRRKIPYTEEEIIHCLRQAAAQIGNNYFSQSDYTRLGPGRPTVKTIVKYKDWKEWMEFIT